jgi:hypothetical protein
MIQFRDPESKNFRGENPRVTRVDVIGGEIRGPAADRNSDRNETAKVLARIDDKQWIRKGDVFTISMTLPPIDRNVYIRVRGTNAADLEPPMDTAGENPWADLWFYRTRSSSRSARRFEPRDKRVLPREKVFQRHRPVAFMSMRRSASDSDPGVCCVTISSALRSSSSSIPSSSKSHRSGLNPITIGS